MHDDLLGYVCEIAVRICEAVYFVFLEAIACANKPAKKGHSARRRRRRRRLQNTRLDFFSISI